MKIIKAIVTILLITTATSLQAQQLFVSGAAGTDQAVNRAEFGVVFYQSETIDVSHLTGYASNNNYSNYLSTGFTADIYIPNSRVFISPDVRIVAARQPETTQYGRPVRSLDLGAAYAVSAGIQFNRALFIGTGIEHFVTHRDHISLNPISFKLKF